jgi:hypothetical protein
MSASIIEQLQSLIANGKIAAPLQKQIAVGSAVELVRLLNSKQVDLGTIVPTMDGGQISFQEILDSRTENVVRRNGSTGTDYVEVHRLSQDTASEWIPKLKAMPVKNSGNGRNFKKGQPKAENGLTQELLLAAIQAMLAGQQPTVAENHSSTETVEEIAKATAIEVNVGDVLSIGGKLVQIVERSNGAFGLNKTIV